VSIPKTINLFEGSPEIKNGETWTVDLTWDELADGTVVITSRNWRRLEPGEEVPAPVNAKRWAVKPRSHAAAITESELRLLDGNR
jgi:hypothetical protein